MKSSLWISVVFTVACAYAQTPRATIIGVVRDPAGLPVPGAAAALTNTGTGEVVKIETGQQGTFTMPNLLRGSYDIRIEKQGFQVLRETGVELAVEQTARLEFRLAVGSVGQTVEVTGVAPLINTEDGTRGQVIEHNELINMPLDSRSFLDLAYLAPGVSPGLPGSSLSGMVANGSRSDNSGLVLDGVQARGLIGAELIGSASLESVQEFKVMTNNYSAEYGRVAGGIMTAVLKGGTNRLHGAGFLFSQDALFNSRSYFAASKNDMRRNQFGGALDGPVILPKLYNGRNKTFFMVSTEFLRQHIPNNGLLTVPTARERTGDFSQSTTNTGAPLVLKDPLGAAGALFANATIPGSRLSPISQKLMQYYPEANRAGRANNYGMSLEQGQSNKNLTTKMDENLTSADRLSFSFAATWTHQEKNLSGTNPAPAFAYDLPGHQIVSGLSYARSFTPTLFADARVGLARTYTLFGTAFGGQHIAQQLGISGLTSDPKLDAFPSFNVSGYTLIGDYTANPGWKLSMTMQYSTNLTWVKGRHLVHFGGDTLRGMAYQTRANNANGVFTFLGNWTSQPFADFTLGYLDSSQRNTVNALPYILSNSWAGYVQDDFKINSRLTLNIGVRYDLMSAPYEKRGRWSNYSPDLSKVVIASDAMLPGLDQQLAAVGLTGKVVLAKDIGAPQSLGYSPEKSFAPRLGLAWRPFGGNRTSVRAGYGIFFATNYLNPYFSWMGGGYPFSITQTFSRNTTDATAVTLSNPFPANRSSIAGTTNTTGVQWHINAPYSQNFNFTVEHEIARSTAVEVAYSGSIGTHLTRAYDINQPYYYDKSKWLSNGSIPRPNPAWGSITFMTMGSASNYHAGLLSVRRRIARGLQFRFNYTLAKGIDDASNYNGSPTGDPKYTRIDRGRSENDTRHLASYNFTYDSPLRNPWGRGWQIAGTGRANSGFPFTPQTQSSNLALGQANRPDRLRDGSLPNPTTDRWFDVTAFTAVPNGAFRPGTSGRDILDGPGFSVLNLSLSRVFKLGETRTAQIRFESFNALNHANFQNPNVFVNAVNGGTISTAFASRTVQFGVRYGF